MARFAFRTGTFALGLLAAFACSSEPEGPSRQSMAVGDLATLRAAIQAWAADHGGELPEDLNLLVRPLPNGVHYLKAGTPALFDPWGSRYEYRPGEGQDGFLVRTLGRDRAPGGRGDDADLDQHSLPE